MTLISSAHAAEVTHPVTASHPHAARNWSVQVGTFRSEEAARAAAAAARREAEAGEVRVEPAGVGRKDVWRAQVIGLTASDAQEACAASPMQDACLVIRPARQLHPLIQP